MAEAMAVAGLASSIITFVDASVKLASICKEFYSSCGQLPRELANCQRLVDEFYLWISDLQRSLSIQGQSSGPTKADEALQRVIENCVVECKCLQELLTSLLPPVNCSSRVPASLTALKSALRLMHKDGKTRRLQQSLESLKNDLRLCIGERTMRLSEQACNQNQRILDDGEKAMQIQSLGHREIVAYLIDHRTRIEDMGNQLGWLEVDTRRTNQKSDEMLLLVRELATSVNSLKTNSAIICISIPRALYNPGLSIYNGFRAYTQRLPMPGGWVPNLWDLRPSPNATGGPDIKKRIAFVTIGSGEEKAEEMDFKPKEVKPGSMIHYKEVYDQEQSWAAWLFCFEVKHAVLYPVVKSAAITSSEEAESSTYKVWDEALKPLRLEDSSRTPRPDLDPDLPREPTIPSTATEDGAMLNTSSKSVSRPAATEHDIFTDTKSGALLPSTLAKQDIAPDTLVESVIQSAAHEDERVTPVPTASHFQETGPVRRHTFPIGSNSQARESNETSADRIELQRQSGRRAPVLTPFGSHLEMKARVQEQSHTAPRRPRRTYSESGAFVTEKYPTPQRIPQITFNPATSTVEDIEDRFTQQQRKRANRIFEAEEIAERLRNTTTLTANSDTFKDVQTAINAFQSGSSNRKISLQMLNNLDNEKLANILTMDLSAAEAARKPFNWGVMLIENQDYAKLFMFQFYIGLGALFLFKPWQSSFYCSLKVSLEQFFMTSCVNYHGPHKFITVFFCRMICACLVLEPIIFLTQLVDDTDPTTGRLLQFYLWLLQLLINSTAFVAIDVGFFRFHLEIILLVFWNICFVLIFVFLWILAANFKIQFRNCQLSHVNVFFLLACFFFIADQMS